MLILKKGFSDKSWRFATLKEMQQDLSLLYGKKAAGKILSSNEFAIGGNFQWQVTGREKFNARPFEHI